MKPILPWVSGFWVSMFVGVVIQVVHTEEGMVMHGEHMKSLDGKYQKGGWWTPKMWFFTRKIAWWLQKVGYFICKSRCSMPSNGWALPGSQKKWRNLHTNCWIVTDSSQNGSKWHGKFAFGVVDFSQKQVWKQRELWGSTAFLMLCNPILLDTLLGGSSHAS